MTIDVPPVDERGWLVVDAYSVLEAAQSAQIGDEERKRIDDAAHMAHYEGEEEGAAAVRKLLRVHDELLAELVRIVEEEAQ
jgi:hypothetical protein